jgi:electron transfer flavoprotein alpha subunit
MSAVPQPGKGDILVLVELLQGEVRDVTFEMLSAARGLGGNVSGLLLGADTARLSEKVNRFCDRLVVVENPGLADFNPEFYQHVMADVIAAESPRLVMIAHSAMGVDLAPALAVKTGLGLVTDVVDVRLDAQGLLFTRQMYSSKICADWRLKDDRGIATVRAGALKVASDEGASDRVARREGQVTRREMPAGLRARRRFSGYEEAPVTGVDITKANAIVAVGRGIKEQKNLQLVEKFAKAIGAEIACSRPVIDSGWLPKERQIGSSGKTVKPKLYIGLGISGAFQHVAGIKGVETIIAVNKDPNAPIFGIAHYGIVGEIMKILPALEAKVMELKAG